MPLEMIRVIVNGCYVSNTTNPTIELVENKNRNKRGTLSKVVIKKAHNSVWFTVDRRSKKWSPYLTDTNGFQKRCDYVIMNNMDGHLIIIFIELKSLNVSKEEMLEKFKATECFMDYCESIAKRFFNGTVMRGCEKRFVVFYLAPSMFKTPSWPKLSNHNKPEKAKLIANHRITSLKQLL